MFPRSAWAAIVSLLFASAGSSASAQITVIGPGSTPQGDILRGGGIFYDGLGRYKVNSAIARRIDTETAIEWNEYVWNSLKAMNRDAAERQSMEVYRTKTNYEAIRRRVRESPNERDLMTGDALNFLLEELSDPKIDPSVLRLARVPLPGATVRQIPFQYGELAGRISMRKLTVRDGWPLALRSKDFAAEREAYRKALDVVLEENLENKLTLDSVKAVLRVVQRLKDRAAQLVPDSDQRNFQQVQVFLKDLQKSCELLQTPLVGDVLAGIDNYPGTSVADLLGFMQRYNLRFSPADPGPERELYHKLFPALVRQREELALEMSGKNHQLPPEDATKK